MTAKSEISYCRHCIAVVYPKLIGELDGERIVEKEWRVFNADGTEHRCPEGAKERGEAA